MVKPLISFVLLSYNQEEFIREALEGAFSQTYSPLEINISDDCSKDGTFDIIQQMVGAYKGPHTVRLNRNATNLGLAENSNRVSDMCQGELIVGAAGDDISLPERTETIVRAWMDSGCKATSLYSKSFDIDRAGRPLGGALLERPVAEQIKWTHERGTIAGFLRRRTPHAGGSSSAIARRLVTTFGPLPKTVTYEDTAISFRTVLAGGHFTFIDAPLVKYRRHGGNLTFALHLARPQDAAGFAEFQSKRRIELDRLIEVYKWFATDAECAVQHGLISPAEYPAIKKLILKERRRFELKHALLVQPWFQRLGIFCKLFSNTIRPRETFEYLPYLLPGAVHRAGVVALTRISRSDFAG